ncbi:MAG: phosphate ABC transporter substrate-binding protein, partial [Candidatus Altiarchaeales archaeon]
MISVILLCGCVDEGQKKETLSIAGSTTVLPINQECARLLMEKNPGLRISVSGGGSGHGIKSVGAGEIDIGAASR